MRDRTMVFDKPIVKTQRFEVSLKGQFGRNNRCLQINRKGFKPSIRRQRYFFQPNDVVEFENNKYLTKGSHCKGSRIIINFNGKIKSVSIKKVRNIGFGKGIIFNNRQFIHTKLSVVSIPQTI